ncbi:MAG TPA: MiaB/RimO family radical SAM methylthiotransferase [Falsiroseomonas sp.]|jgi:threonylcarbamoyladenosine tRNA methylthiotransferase MtaB|nr:MiaB/RimO family radical SAM methylthiotransferase [Falsiroseomonas sp.]
MTPEILTFGCRLNASESDAIRALAAGQGDALIVNTCAVTTEAERQARQAIRKAARENPARRILVTGCAAEIAPDAWAGLPGVERVIANAAKLRPDSWAMPGDAPGAMPDPPVGLGSRTRALVQVQQGCDHRCTFCVIPFGRGPSRSVPVGAVVEQVRGLVACGHKEVVLTGVDIASYGPDLPGRPTLGQMVRRLLALVPELPRLRLSSLDPVGMDDDLWRLLSEEARLMPHLHLSLQHGADLILKRMKRRHSRAEAVALCARARRLRPDIAFGADLIAGFPTETEDHFAEMLAMVEECGLTFLHVFPYSERPGTPAARMPALPVKLRRERAARLREAGRQAARRFCEGRLGRVEQVLLEAPGRGHSAHFAPVRLRGGAGLRGELRMLRAVALDEDGLIGSDESREQRATRE